MANHQYLEANPGSESYFYGSHLTSGCVPRFIISLTMPIDGAVLQQTMDAIVPRFPQMCVRVERTPDNKNYVLKDNHAPCPVFHDKGDVVRTLGTADTNEYLFMVTYDDNRLMIDYHHLLGDGTGFIIFARAILFDYLKRQGLPVEKDASILTTDEPYDEEEGEVPYYRLQGKPAAIPEWYVSRREVFNVPCPGTEDDPADTIVQIRMPFDKLRQVFSQYESSPVTFLGPIFSHAIYKEYEKVIGDKCIVASIPVNLRPYFPTKTLRYFITIAVLAHSELFLKQDFPDIIRTQKTLLADQTTPEFLTYMARRQSDGMKRFRALDMSVEEKAQMMDAKVKASMKDYTYIITNMGKVSLPPSMAAYVTEFYPILPTATCPFTIATTTWKNELMLSIAQRRKDSAICERFVEMLNQLDIPARITDKFEFHTMRCKPL